MRIPQNHEACETFPVITFDRENNFLEYSLFEIIFGELINVFGVVFCFLRIMSELIQRIKQSWKISLSDKSFRIRIIVSSVGLVLILWTLTNFLSFVETRPGFSFEDPMLSLFSPIDLTWAIFVVIYAATTLAVISLIDKPIIFLAGIQTYLLMVLIRIIAMYLLPLEPPQLMIALKDPVVQLFVGVDNTLTKDLFFSGHTATLFIMYLISEKKSLIKLMMLSATIITGLMVILQHVHYSIDVFSAPFFTYIGYRFVIRFNRNSFMQLRNY